MTVAALASLFTAVSLLAQPMTAEWRKDRTADEGGLIRKWNTHTAGSKTLLTLRLNHRKADASAVMRFEIPGKTSRSAIRVLDAKGSAVAFDLEVGGRYVEREAGEVFFEASDNSTVTLRPNQKPTDTIVIEVEAPLESVKIYYTSRQKQAQTARTNLAPVISPPRHQAVSREPVAREVEDGFVLENRALTAKFITGKKLRLESLRNEYAGKEMIGDPARMHLFLIETAGQRYAAADWTVEKVSLLSSQRVQVDLKLDPHGLTAALTLSIDEQGIKWGLRVENHSDRERTWKTVFPQLGGLAISDSAADDYYLFPLRGGLIQKINANLRANYGANVAWWQMICLFSPQSGTSMALRCLDESGLYKGIAFRKGPTASEGATVLKDLSLDRIAPGSYWENSLEGGEGSAMGFEYVDFIRHPGEGLSLPEAMLEVYPGDWRPAMKAYADWAHRVWKWQPLKSRLNDVWQILVVSNYMGGGGQVPDLIKDGKWYDGYAANDYEMAELGRWWEWSRKGPFGTSMANPAEELGPRLVARYNLPKRDPISGEFVNPGGGRGDYAEPVSWGGWPAMRRSIDAAHKANKLISLYTSPMLVSDSSGIGTAHGREYAVINPYFSLPPDVLPTAPRDKDYVIHHMSFRFCIGIEAYQNFVADQMAEIVKNTHADVIRLDEVGHTGIACFNPEHKHMFGELGQHSWMRSMESMTRKVHSAISKAAPGTLLMAEYPGSDFLSAALDGALTYEAHTWSHPELRLFPVNIFRFYFPEVRLYELRPQMNKSLPHGGDLAFWNGVGMFIQPHQPAHHQILRENSDAFGSRNVEPLVPTLAKQVYANRFAAGRKEITLLFNDNDTEVAAPVMAAQEDSGYHFFDLLNHRPLHPQEGALTMKIKAKSVGAIARLPRLLSLGEKEGGRTLLLAEKPANASIALCDRSGAILDLVAIEDADQLLSRHAAEADRLLKLFSGGILLDVLEL